MKCIFLHGLGQNDKSWDKTINSMNYDLEINSINLFKLPNNNINYKKIYDDFSNHCDLQSEPLNLCGLSLGGIIALEYTIRNPKKVNSLVLIGTQYKIPKRLMQFQNIIFRLLPKKVFDKMNLSKDQIISLTKSMLNLDFEKELKKINCPVLIIYGKKDKANMNASIKMKKLINNSKLKVIEKAGHEVNIDNPISLGKILNDFFINL